MQIIEIGSITGTSPYDITVCDITYTYCYSVGTGLPSVPPILYLNLPTELSGVDSIIITVTDSNNCEESKIVNCPVTPTPTPTHTPTPTITPTNATCVCIKFYNPTLTTLNYSYINCNGNSIQYTINPFTTVYQCGKNPTYDSGVVVTFGEYCNNNQCPPSSVTPTPTNTPTSTIPGLVGSFISCCHPQVEFKISSIPTNMSPLSGVYYIVSSGFIGCATYIPSTLSTNIYNCQLIGSQPDCVYCDFSHPNVLCPTPSPTQTPTQTPSPTQTPTQTPTPTPTPTQTPI